MTLSHISGLVCLWRGPVCQALGTGGSLSATREVSVSWEKKKKKYGEYLFVLKEIKVDRRRGGGEGG